MYRDSSDTKVSSAGIEVRTGKKWKACETVNQAELTQKRTGGNSDIGSGRVWIFFKASLQQDPSERKTPACPRRGPNRG